MSRRLAVMTTAALAVGLSGSAFAQITSTVQYDPVTLTAEDMVRVLTGPENGLQTFNETYTGAPNAAGRFYGGASVFGPLMDEGIILSSGDIHGDCGPVNSTGGYNGIGSSSDHQLPGDPWLDQLTGGFGTTYDAAILEFDFTCADLQEISFLFVFASEEYNEWVGSPFNDVFGFFLDGTNIALVPVNPPVPVAVNNVNNGTPPTYGTGGINPSFYLNNVEADGATLPVSDWQDLPIEMDGMTVILAAASPLIGAGPHHMKLAIADTSDFILDSAVFIAANTFNCGDPLVVELGHFGGRMDTSGNVMLSWATLSEIDNAGFNIYREPWSDRALQMPSAAAVLINQSALIPARGNPFESTAYRWMDRSSHRNDVYYYWLEDIDTSGRSTLHGPIVIR